MQLRRTREWRWAGRLACLLTLAALTFVLSSVLAQDVFKDTVSAPGETKNIQIYADDMATWQAGAERAILLRGHVAIGQGPTAVRFNEGIIWLNEDEQKKSGTYSLDVYGEGSADAVAAVDLGDGPRSTGKLLVRLTTRGEIGLKTNSSKIQQSNLSEDPLFRRALDVRAGKEPTETRTTLPRPPELMPNVGETPPVLPNLPTPPQNAGAAPASQDAVRTAAVGPSDVPTQPAAPVAQQTLPDTLPGTPPTPPMPPSLPPSYSQDLPPAEPTPTDALPAPPPGDGPARQLNIRPRGTQDMQAIKQVLPNGETAIIIPTGVILTVSNPREKKVLIDIEADRVVFWTRGNVGDPFNNMKSPQGETSKQMEFYLSGNVEIRNQTKTETQILRASECYYDVGRNVAVALKGDLEIRSPKTIYPLHFKADELLQLGPKVFTGRRTQMYATVLPSDPGLKIEIQETTLEELDTPRTNIFGRQFYDLKTGELRTNPQRILKGKNAIIRLEGIPIWYWPWVYTDAEDPTGPLDGVAFNYSRIFGFQLLTTWNMFDLLGIAPGPGRRWQLDADYMSARGPALGTTYLSAGKDIFGFDNKYEGLVKMYGIDDHGNDNIGGGRGTNIHISPTQTVPVTHPELRGWAKTKFQIFDMPNGFTFQVEAVGISDRNFLEQFMNGEWNRELNQETFAYLKQQQDHWAWTFLTEPRLRPWLTETEWLPKGEFNFLGAKIFDNFTYNLRSSAGYARLRPAQTEPPPYDPTDQAVNTGRFDVIQDISYPFALGAVKLAPYAVFDLAYYTEDLAGNNLGRVYGGGGLRANMPLSKLYPNIKSDLFNLDGIYHKIVFSANYYYAQSSAHINQLPQLDRLNDDASDQALRDIHPVQTSLNPASGAFLTTSKIFDPQIYELRRLADNRVDTLDSIDVLQLGIRQRWQTKRGFVDSEHVVDWMTLDLQGSVFPQANRDNFGQYFGILQYDWTWNVGDRTALVSNGWFETLDDGPRVFTIGTVLNRPDRTNVYLGYRQIDPLNSRAVVASLTYAFSAKYAMTASTLYDFGVHTQTNMLMLSRVGTDLRISFGLSYNSILNNFGILMEIVPNLLPGAGRLGQMGGMNGAPGMPGSPTNPSSGNMTNGTMGGTGFGSSSR